MQPDHLLLSHNRDCCETNTKILFTLCANPICSQCQRMVLAHTIRLTRSCRVLDLRCSIDSCQTPSGLRHGVSW
jgi:hypothetical protein